MKRVYFGFRLFSINKRFEIFYRWLISVKIGTFNFNETFLIARLAPSLFRQSKKIGKGKTVSGRLITDDEIDLGQVYLIATATFLN